MLGGRFGILAVGAHGEGRVHAAHGPEASLVAAGLELSDDDLDEIEQTHG